MNSPSTETGVSEPSASDAPLHSTPLVDEHRALGARMVPFAGYLMPVQYTDGILSEHVWTRSHAGLFDVSHMGQAVVSGPDFATTAAALEALVPGDIAGLAPGRIRYTQLLTEDGGIVDDLMVTRPVDPAEDGRLFLVVNASRKEGDFALISEGLPAGITLSPMPEKALLALQGPEAAAVLRRLSPTADELAFMAGGPATVAGFDCHVSRSGYTGEDGFEISVSAGDAVALWRALMAEPEVKAIGLGARDSLRLEAGLCLYGHDIDETTSPVEAALVWSIGKRRREEGGFPGFPRIRSELTEGPGRKRVGLKPEGRAPAREGTEIHADGRRIGIVTSGGFGPTVAGPVAMGYVETPFAKPGTEVSLIVRGKPLPARVVTLPFVPARYKR